MTENMSLENNPKAKNVKILKLVATPTTLDSKKKINRHYSTTIRTFKIKYFL